VRKKKWHVLVGAFAGGSVSALTLPLDNVIAQTQKIIQKVIMVRL
jgi:hypothetical protein